jgi:hypothetical protein
LANSTIYKTPHYAVLFVGDWLCKFGTVLDLRLFFLLGFGLYWDLYMKTQKVKGKVVPDVWGNGCIDPCISEFEASRR